MALEITNDISKNFAKDIRYEDIYLISKILEKASNDRNTLDHPENFYEIVNNIMTLQKNILDLSQQHYKAIDKILQNLDKLLLKTTKAHFVTLPWLLVRTIKSSEEMIGGMIKDNNSSQPFIPLYAYNYKKKLQTTKFEVAFHIPFSIGTILSDYFVILFRSDKFFDNAIRQVPTGKWIIRILTPNVNDYYFSTIEVYFNQLSSCNIFQSCSQWNYNNLERNSGRMFRSLNHRYHQHTS
ncbi:hypothetical protein BDFB_002212 [Asbolus verrucosus]|uniref:Uncharacterized protein n=1 Tax=Asbolus verrucosus TaxID=1661398 RepID=A0A482W1S5_ASBVE|nr:hypothetical protein BDFB_002212 [Asbolus verrucosus]